MTTDEAKPEHDFKATDPAAIVSITRRILSGVMRFCLIVIDVPNTLHPTRIRRRSGVHLGISPVLSTTSIEGASRDH